MTDALEDAGRPDEHHHFERRVLAHLDRIERLVNQTHVVACSNHALLVAIADSLGLNQEPPDA
jgi:hypothetical protein